MAKLKDFLPFARYREERTNADLETRVSSSIIPLRQTYSTFTGVPVNDQSALSVAAAWRCVNLIADSIARLPMNAYRNGVEVSAPPLLIRPNVQQTRYDTIFQLAVSLLLRGNAYGIPFDYDYAGYPRQIYVVHPDCVVIQRLNGVLTYTINDGADSLKLTSADIMHIRGFMMPGAVVGVGVIESQREGIGHALAMQEYGQRFFNESAIPPVAIKVPGELSREDAQNLKDDWVAKHAGRSRQPAVLPNGMSIETISITPEDSQFIQSRQMSLAEVALMFGVPGHFVGAPGSSMTYSNTEQESLNLIQWALTNWLCRIEQAFSDFMPRATTARFNVDALLRSSTLDRYAAHKIALDAGWLTIDEVRDIEKLPPLAKTQNEEPPVLVEDEDNQEETNN